MKLNIFSMQSIKKHWQYTCAGMFAAMLSFSAAAQKITISGYVKDAASKEALIGASVASVNSKVGTSTNQYGFFTLTFQPTDTVDLIISYSGYIIQAKKNVLKENIHTINRQMIVNFFIFEVLYGKKTIELNNLIELL